MPRPLADWPPFEAGDLISSPLSPVGGLISGFLASFPEYAKAVLESGYAESSEITNRDRALTIARDKLDTFTALSPQEISQLNDDEHEIRLAEFRKPRDERIEAKSRLQSALDDANAFTPPSAAHQKFADFLIEELTTAIADIQTTGPDPPQPSDNAFSVREEAALQAVVVQLVGVLEGEGSPTDILWVKDLLDAL